MKSPDHTASSLFQGTFYLRLRHFLAMTPFLLLFLCLSLTGIPSALAGTGCECRVLSGNCVIKHPEASRATCYEVCGRGDIIVTNGQKCTILGENDFQAYYDGTLLTSSGSSGSSGSGSSGGSSGGSTGSSGGGSQPPSPSPSSSPAPAPVPSSSGICAGVTCSGHGTCFSDLGWAQCNCDTGFHLFGYTTCGQKLANPGFAVNLLFNSTSSFACLFVGGDPPGSMTCRLLNTPSYWFPIIFPVGTTIPKHTSELATTSFLLPANDQADAQNYCLDTASRGITLYTERCDKASLFNLIPVATGQYYIRSASDPSKCLGIKFDTVIVYSYSPPVTLGNSYMTDCGSGKTVWYANFNGIVDDSFVVTNPTPTPSSESPVQTQQPSTPTTQASAQNVPSSSSGLSAPAIAGIVIGSLAAVGLTIVGLTQVVLAHRKATAPIIVSGISPSEMEFGRAPSVLSVPQDEYDIPSNSPASPPPSYQSYRSQA